MCLFKNTFFSRQLRLKASPTMVVTLFDLQPYPEQLGAGGDPNTLFLVSWGHPLGIVCSSFCSNLGMCLIKNKNHTNQANVHRVIFVIYGPTRVLSNCARKGQKPR